MICTSPRACVGPHRRRRRGATRTGARPRGLNRGAASGTAAVDGRATLGGPRVPVHAVSLRRDGDRDDARPRGELPHGCGLEPGYAHEPTRPIDELGTPSMARHRIRHSPRAALGRPLVPSPTKPQPSPCRGAHVHPQHPPNTRQAPVRTRSLPRCDLWIPVIRCGRQNAPSPLSTGTCRTNHRTPGRTLASAPRFFLRVPTRV